MITKINTIDVFVFFFKMKTLILCFFIKRGKGAEEGDLVLPTFLGGYITISI